MRRVPGGLAENLGAVVGHNNPWRCGIASPSMGSWINSAGVLSHFEEDDYPPGALEWDCHVGQWITQCHCCAGKSWLQCPLHNKKKKQTWFPWWCHIPTVTIQHLNTHSTVFTNRNVLVASVVNEEWRWQTQQNLSNPVFIPCLLVSLNT